MGFYADDGSWNLTVVDGSTYVGVYAADGSINVVDQTSSSDYVGMINPCGAYNVTLDSGTDYVGRVNPNGSLNVNTTTRANGSQLVTVVSGTLGSGGPSHGTSLLLQDGSYLLLQSGDTILLQ